MSEFNLNTAQTSLAPIASDTYVRAWSRVLILLGLSGYFAYNIATGNLSNYINARFVWLSYVATTLFFALGIASAIQVFLRTRIGATVTARALTWGVLVVGAVPLVFGVMVPSKPLGADAVNGSISTTAVRGANSTNFSIAPENRNILDWLRSFNESADYTAFNDQPVNLIGFVYREPDFPDNQFMVARFTMSCCVADASALGLPVAYTGPTGLESGTWIQVTGKMQVGKFGEDLMPIIQPDDIITIEQPEHPYLYP